MNLQVAWQALWHTLPHHATPAQLQALYLQLQQAWSEPQRHYHTPQHLQECLTLAASTANGLPERAALELALWFHDAVYDVQATDNEARSADWAAQALGELGVDAAIVARVQTLILATCHQAATSTDLTTQLLLDIDLAILGAPPARFAEYEAQIRAEYAWVPMPLFRSRRAALLQQFLARPQLYQTPRLHAQLETAARYNLQQALAGLDQ